MKHLIPAAMFNRKYGAEMAWAEKQKKAIEDEIAMFRRNSVEPDADDNESLTLSEWPLCSLYPGMSTCEGCPVFIKTGIEHCDGTPIKMAIQMWDDYSDGETSIGGLSNAITEAADWLENEVLNDDHD